MNTENIIRKVQALLNRTTDKGATPEEMETALKIANKLMEEYSLSFEDLKVEDVTIKEGESNEINTKNYNDFLMMALSVSEVFHCNIIRVSRRTAGARRAKMYYKVVGETEHIAFVEFLLTEIMLNVIQSYYNYSKEHKFDRHSVLREKYSYERGYFDAVKDKAEQILKEREAQKGTGTSLMVIDHALQIHMKQYKTATLKYVNRQHSEDAYNRGFEKGQSQSLEKRFDKKGQKLLS